MADSRIERRGWQYWEKMHCELCFHSTNNHMDEGGSFISCDAMGCTCAEFKWYTWDGIKIPYYHNKQYVETYS